MLDDVEDMKKVLKFFKLSAAANKLNLQKGVTVMLSWNQQVCQIQLIVQKIINY